MALLPDPTRQEDDRCQRRIQETEWTLLPSAIQKLFAAYRRKIQHPMSRQKNILEANKTVCQWCQECRDLSRLRDRLFDHTRYFELEAVFVAYEYLHKEMLQPGLRLRDVSENHMRVVVQILEFYRNEWAEDHPEKPDVRQEI